MATNAAGLASPGEQTGLGDCRQRDVDDHSSRHRNSPGMSSAPTARVPAVPGELTTPGRMTGNPDAASIRDVKPDHEGTTTGPTAIGRTQTPPVHSVRRPRTAPAPPVARATAR